jgi:hypothetical protein
MRFDPRVDAYIANAPAYAQPILNHLRKLVHEAVPDVTETVKWRYPTFEHHGIMCGLAAFKSYATFGFWKAKLLVERGFPEAGDHGLGRGGKVTSMDDLPSDARLIRLIKEAAKLNEQGIRIERPKARPRPVLKAPPYFMAAVKKNKKALAHFQAFSPTKKRDYVEWITDAKTGDTRTKRLTQAVAWIAEGKSRNWKYEKRA